MVVIFCKPNHSRYCHHSYAMKQRVWIQQLWRLRHFLLFAASVQVLLHVFVHPRDLSGTTTKPKTLSFGVCNGYTNQRLSVFYGIVLAKQLKRRIEIPKLILNGKQTDASNVLATGTNMVPYEHFYDGVAFRRFLTKNSIPLAQKEQKSRTTVKVADNEIAIMLKPGSTLDQVDHISLGCPLFSITGDEMVTHRDLFLNYLPAMKPSAQFQLHIDKAMEHLGGNFNFLHLRIEQDWIKHCSIWRAGAPSDNCFTNTLKIHEHLAIKGIKKTKKLYISLDWDGSFKPLAKMVIDKIHQAGYDVAVQRDVFFTKFEREEAALVDYYLALAATKFLGNSVSTFSAMVILERQIKGNWASYYNMGDIPLSTFLPFYKMPWVFTYNGESPSYDYMLKLSILSGVQIGRLTPFCLYSGSKNDAIYRWMVAQNVRIIQHVPKWKDRLDKVYKTAAKNVVWSPLYGSKLRLFGTLQRLDIPVVRDLSEYNYVLFSDADTIFLRRISLESFPMPLPSTLSMAYEMDNTFPCNAGVSLMNLPGMRSSHSLLIDFTFENPSLHFGDYGPIDQGALNEFYRQSMGHECRLSELFNKKPYKNGGLKQSYILHFHGPKLHDYLEWMQTRKCSFGDKCRKGAVEVCRDIHAVLQFKKSIEILDAMSKQCCRRFRLACGATKRLRLL